MHLVAIFLSLTLLANAQKGQECVDGSGCDKYQSCSFGYCRCYDGFIKINKSCYKDQVKHGDICHYDIQCNDHRLTCLEDEGGEKRCRCFKLYVYDEELQECVHAKNLTEMLSLLQEQWDNIGRIEAEANKVFRGLVAAGLLSIVLGIIFAGGCVIYGCCIPHWKMKQFSEPDYQTMPLCPVSREPAEIVPQEPTTPTGQTVKWDEPSSEMNSNHFTSASEIIV